MMKKAIGIAVLVGILVCTPALAFEKKAFMMRDDYGVAPLQGCTMQYYYYVPCPTYGWFWGFYDWTCGETIGQFFTVGDTPTGGGDPCDPMNCHHVVGASVLDFAGYGTIYPGLFTVRFDIYCSDSVGVPVGPALWTSAPYETHAGWNDITISPGVMITGCATEWGFWPSHPRFLLTATHVGTECTYPQWAFDNISAYLNEGCELHLIESLPLRYPRPYDSYYSEIHSGYYGIDFEYTPPLLFLDGADTTSEGTQYGFLELAWKVMLECLGPSTEATTWGDVKAMYK